MTLWVAMASGPSLHVDDVAVVQAARATGLCKVAVVNRTWERAPWADLLYAGDSRWWRKHDPQDKFDGQKFTLGRQESCASGVQSVMAASRWSTDPDYVYTGGLSGIHTVNLLANRGATGIVLLGYDCCYRSDGRRHWHADYDERAGFSNVPDISREIKNFEHIATNCPVKIVNASRVTAIPYFERMSISDALHR